MDKVIDLAMTKLFQLVEYVCSKCSATTDEPAATKEVEPVTRFTKEVAPTIRFTNEDKMVEGELFQ